MQRSPSTEVPVPERQKDPPSATFAVRVAIAYDDLSARERAMRLLYHLENSVGPDVRFDRRPWSFNLLSDASYSDLAVKDAIDAEILIITRSTVETLPPEVNEWARTAFDCKQGQRAAVVALFGSEDDPEGPDSPPVQKIQAAAREAGLDFFSPSALPELNQAITRTHRREETVTPASESNFHHSTTLPPNPNSYCS